MKKNLDLKNLTLGDLKDAFGAGDDGKCEYRPYRDWYLMLVIAAVFFFAIGLGHYYLYRQYNAEDESAVAPARTLKVGELKQVARTIDQETEKFQLLLEFPDAAANPL
ncbi:MAG TPA: hypothetical protein VEB60_02815 [Candidatus Paceibacterota bacterium]|nr:hypothetical protein [Candidatus Paceibacterota bacterium]